MPLDAAVTNSDLNYLLFRQQVERSRAATAQSAAARKVHRDLADLYVRLAAHPTASGIFHANDEADERVRHIVEAIARHVRVQPDVRHVPMEEARAKMGQYADALALDQIVRSPRARALGWAPTLHSVAGNVAGLIEEFRSGQEAAA